MKSSTKDKSVEANRPTLSVTIRLRRGPLSPWFRFGIKDSLCKTRGPEPVAQKQFLRDFCLHFQVEGTSWVWCEALQASLAVTPGDVLFLPPGFVYAWAYVGETHLAVHYDLQRNSRLTPHNYEGSYNMIQPLEGQARERPCATMPVFHLLQPGQDAGDAWRIPMLTRVPNPEEWKRRMGDLVHRWETRTLESVPSQLRACRTLGWALEELTSHEAINVHLADPRISEFLGRLRDPAVLAEVSRQTVPEIARRLGMGETIFRERFRGMTARPPHQYFREVQVYQASRALKETTRRIKDIAQYLGFEDPYHFSRVFTAIAGCSPAEYRKRMERTERTPQRT